MNNSTENTNNMDQTTTTPEHLDYQDMPDIAQLKDVPQGVPQDVTQGESMGETQ